MSTRLYSVYDKAAERYLDPFTAPTDSVAIRGFSDAVNKDGHPFNLHPEDYVLVVCGEFDGESGVIAANNGPSTLVAGYQVQLREALEISEESDAN